MSPYCSCRRYRVYCSYRGCCSCRRNGRTRTCGLPVPGRTLFLLSHVPSRVRPGWRGPYRTRRGPADRAGVATPLAESQSHPPLSRGQSRSGGSNPVLPGGSRLPYRFGLCGVSPGKSRGESFRTLQGEGTHGFVFTTCCAVHLSGAGKELPPVVAGAAPSDAGNGEAAWTGVSGGSVVSPARAIHLAVRGPGHRRRAAGTPPARPATPVMRRASLSFPSWVRSVRSGFSPLKGKGGLRRQWFYPCFSPAVFSRGRCEIHRTRSRRPGPPRRPFPTDSGEPRPYPAGPAVARARTIGAGSPAPAVRRLAGGGSRIAATLRL